MASIISASTTSGTALNMSADTTGVLQLATGATPTTALTIDTSQNVGIGTTSPTVKLDVSGTSRYTFNVSNAYTIQTSVNAAISAFADSYYNANQFIWQGSGTERMRIDSNGTVCINSTSPPVSDNRLTITYASATQSAASIKNTSTTFGGNLFTFYNASTAQCGAITQTATTTTAYTTSSDYRLKENIVPMTGALDKVLQLKPVTYTWKEDGSDGQGFIAHELKEVVPDAVVGEKDAVNEDGSIKPQSIDTSFLVANLTAAIQEQQTIINDLKARIETLESK